MREIYGGIRWERQTEKHLQDPKFLESHGYKVYSQNDEDGILQEIFDRIGTETKQFVEFGVQDGLECNSHYLLHKGWTGLWLEGDGKFYQQIQKNFAAVIAEGLLKTKCVFITKDNIDGIIKEYMLPGDVDLLSIDIDGNDYYVWDAISCIKPRVVCIEYNGRFPPDYEWVMPYFSEHVWGENDYFGASLKALEKLGRRKGYQLVGTNLTGVNAFFVREDLAQGKFPEPATAEVLYNAPRYTWRHITGHPNKFCLLGEKYFLQEQEIDGTEFEDRMFLVNAQMDADTLFDILVNAAEKTDCIVIENEPRDYQSEQAILCFLDRYKMFLEYVHIEDPSKIKRGSNESYSCESKTKRKIYIKLNRTLGKSNEVGYAALADAYTESYYMTDCGGYYDFKKSQGMDITARLKNIYSLVDPTRRERILDIGCGRGELTFALARAGAEVEGVDYSKDAIAIAQKTFEGKCEGLRYTYADILEMDNLASFDKIVMADVVEHIEPEFLEKIFEKIAVSLNRTGCLIIHTAPNKNYYEITYPQIREQAARLGCWKPREPRSYYEQLMHINEQTPEKLEDTLKKYFRYVHIWTGSFLEMDNRKSPDESCKDIDIFAIACQDNDQIERRLSKFTKRPELDECLVQLESTDIVLQRGENSCIVPVTLKNLGSEVISSQRKYPINLAYHIFNYEGKVILFDGERTPVFDEIQPGMEQKIEMQLRLPLDLDPSEKYICRITLVAENCFWFDQDGGNKTDVSLSMQ